MRREPIRFGIKRWLLAAPLVAQQLGCPGAPFGSNCPDRSVRLVALSAIQAHYHMDGGAWPDGGTLVQDGEDGGLIDLASITVENCAQICRDVILFDSFGNVNACGPTTLDGGAGGASCDVSVPCMGRAPEGLERSQGSGRDALGAYLARAATLEAASIHSFAKLAEELEAHGAPTRLVRAARRAARDEIRHARAMTRLARRFGGRPAVPSVAPSGPRALAAVLAENRVEGCVRETYGAVVGKLQALRARSPEVRTLFGQIARDEGFHAEISHAVRHWGEPRLASSERAKLDALEHQAVEALRDELQLSPEVALQEELGLPEASTATAILDAMRRDLWS